MLFSNLKKHHNKDNTDFYLSQCVISTWE